MNGDSFSLALSLTEPARLIDASAGGGAWLIGFAITCVSLSLLGLAAWLAANREPDGALPVFGRGGLGCGGLLVLLLGLVLVAGGSEAMLGYPLGPGSSGGGSILAYWLASKAAVFEAALTLGLCAQLHERTGSELHHALTWAAGLSLAITWTLSKVLALLAFMVAGDALLW